MHYPSIRHIVGASRHKRLLGFHYAIVSSLLHLGTRFSSSQNLIFSGCQERQKERERASISERNTECNCGNSNAERRWIFLLSLIIDLGTQRVWNVSSSIDGVDWSQLSEDDVAECNIKVMNIKWTMNARHSTFLISSHPYLKKKKKNRKGETVSFRFKWVSRQEFRRSRPNRDQFRWQTQASRRGRWFLNL